ncbi:ferrochelatase [Aureibacter tunicatorum]|uniref:Ferrochelatase n=1 Tax=Aureibacter tunicatorum TaxID=866807 RepID=A0AAE4BQZ5_9BACT|nr:ferrochelatase [Aureibacter tunicatorum]MDR6237250.1 ferrochelatase [Aureibacter tunicatorum]BDD06242.1 ferrochelatase [Aureibacter tunicatorum]
MKKKGILIVNLGTPDSPSVPDVRKYLREFLMDGRVIDIPFLSRWMLVNLIIAPFRAPKSAKVYEELWDERGSPLLYYGEDVVKALKEELPNEYEVELAMRYQSPSIENGLQALKSKCVSEILVLPLFPQYASATTGSVVQKVNDIVNTWQVIPSIKFVNQFLEEESFMDALTIVAKKYVEEEKYDHFLFSYHGLPERQIHKASVDGYCKLNDKCCSTFHKKNQYCYRAQCFETSRLLASRLGIEEENYTVCFQSRLGKDPWIQPYADDLLKELPKQGKKRVLAFSPSFVADCLETTIEVGEEFKEEFIDAGGEKWDLVESLNNHPLWINCLKEIILKNT